MLDLKRVDAPDLSTKKLGERRASTTTSAEVLVAVWI